MLQTAPGETVPENGDADIVIALSQTDIRATVFVALIADEFIL